MSLEESDGGGPEEPDDEYLALQSSFDAQQAEFFSEGKEGPGGDTGDGETFVMLPSFCGWSAGGAGRGSPPDVAQGSRAGAVARPSNPMGDRRRGAAEEPRKIGNPTRRRPRARTAPRKAKKTPGKTPGAGRPL